MLTFSTNAHSARARAVGWQAWAGAAVLALGCAAVAMPSAVAADQGADEDSVLAEAEGTEAAEVGAEADDSERQQSDVEALESAVSDDEILFVMVEPESPESEQVCRNVRVTGTRIPQRVCRTVRQWEESEAAGREQAERFTRELGERSTIVPPVDPEEGEQFIHSGLATGF